MPDDAVGASCCRPDWQSFRRTLGSPRSGHNALTWRSTCKIRMWFTLTVILSTWNATTFSDRHAPSHAHAADGQPRQIWKMAQTFMAILLASLPLPPLPPWHTTRNKYFLPGTLQMLCVCSSKLWLTRVGDCGGLASSAYSTQLKVSRFPSLSYSFLIMHRLLKLLFKIT